MRSNSQHKYELRTRPDLRVGLNPVSLEDQPMTDTKNKIKNSALMSRYRASEEEHQRFAREMEGELVISITPSRMVTPKASDTEQE